MAPLKHASSRDLRHRLLTCLTNLSDRDTHSLAAKELQSIIPTLTADTFSLFINSLSSTSSVERSAVRVTAVRLLGDLAGAHCNALAPHLSKLVTAVLRRLRDPDSAVRSACVTAVSSFASRITKPPFASFFRPFADSIATEQDVPVQSAAALCLAAAVDASPEPDTVQIKKALPKWIRLLKCDSFKAKSSLIVLIQSVVKVCEIGNCNLLRDLVNCLAELLKSEDWTARKAAAEVLGELAVTEKDSLSEMKASCLKSFESRKFDKVKAVREAMNQMVGVWKEMPDEFEDGSPPPRSQASLRENASDGRYPSGSRISSKVDSSTPQSRKKFVPPRRSFLSDSALKTTARSRGAPDDTEKRSNTIFRNLERKKAAEWNVEVKNRGCDDNQARDRENARLCKPELKRGLFRKNTGSRVVPYPINGSEATVVVSNTTEDACRHRKDCEDLSLIRKQLVQIETQQSSMMDLLQKFIGSSQEGMRSLETRVHGLELALDDVSYDLAVSTTRMSTLQPPRSSCWLLPGSEFLSSKFRRKREGRCSTSGVSYSTSIPSVAAMLEGRRLGLRGPGGVIVNPLAEIRSDSRGISEASSSRGQSVYKAA